MTRFLCLVGLVLVLGISLSQGAPTPPKSWPAQFYVWLITSVVEVNKTQPLYVYGQNIAYDLGTNFTTRWNQQNLTDSSPVRANDYCDYVKGVHYRVNDTSGGQGQNPPCAAAVKTGSFQILTWPQEFVQSATYLGTDHVNDEYCDHFYMRPIVIDKEPYQMDIWTSTGDQYPCQISIQNIPQEGKPLYITTWAFTGFRDTLPTDIGVAALAKIQCTQKDWVCHAVSNASSNALLQALNYACGIIDCSPIQPGGSNYYPNTIIDHCNWAFNQYYQTFKLNQGYDACQFGGVAQLVPPSQQEVITLSSKRNSYDFPPPPLFPVDFVCPSLW